MTTIKQVVIEAERRAVLAEADLPDDLAPNEIRIDTEYTFISTGTELSIYTGVEPQSHQAGSWCAYPYKAGYANVGVVSAVGEMVTRVSVGDRLFTFGKHASAIVISDEEFAVPVPASLDPKIAVASRMAGVAATAPLVAERPLNPWVAVFGLGMVGNLAAQMFRILGANVVGIDPVAGRRRIANECGIARTLSGSIDEVRTGLIAATGGRLADIVIDATGLSSVILSAAEVTADFGLVILLGSPRAPLTANVTDFLGDIQRRSITVRGAFEWCLPSYPVTAAHGGTSLPLMSMLEKQQMIFDWIGAEKLTIAPLISKVQLSSRASDAYEMLLTDPENCIGIVLDWKSG